MTVFVLNSEQNGLVSINPSFKKPILKVISKTIIGGIFFLLPIVIIVFLLGKALTAVRSVADAIREKAPLKFQFLALIISILILLFFCFLAEWVAEKGTGKATATSWKTACWAYSRDIS